MNRREIEQTIKEIKALSWDSEASHGREDKLHIDFINHIAESSVKPYSDWAKLIIELSNDESLKRWCA